MKTKILIIGFNERGVMPYLDFYINLLKENKIEFDVLEWDRRTNSDITKTSNFNTIHIKAEENKFKKIIAFFRWRLQSIRFLKENKYSMIIVLTTIPSVLLYKFLQIYYKGRYIIDIRDFTYENINFYRYIVKKVLFNSSLNIISSKGFIDFLGNENDFYLLHNVPYCINVTYPKTLKNQSKYTIGYLGILRYFDINSCICFNLRNDKHFDILYKGLYLDDELKKFCRDNNINNVSFENEFINSEKKKIYEKIDFINAAYGCASMLTTTAVPNKLYDALIYRIPIIVSKNTYLSIIVEKYGIGISIDKKTDIKEAIYKFINNYQVKDFDDKCKILLDEVLTENKKTIEKILEVIKK